MISFNLVMLLIGVVLFAIVIAWLASARLRSHVEQPKHELIAKVERDHGPWTP
jgi:hypothetical protein